MRFGLFGGAKSAGEGAAGDSLGYRHYIDYVLLAEELGYHSVFVVEHHFTGVGQLSASLNFLSYLAGRTTRMRLGTAVVFWNCPAIFGFFVTFVTGRNSVTNVTKNRNATARG